TRWRRVVPGSSACTSGRPSLLPTLEDLDRVALGERHHGTLLVGAPALRIAPALELAASVHRVDRDHPDLPDRLNGLLDLRLVRVRADDEGVRVLLDPGVGLLGHDRADDDVARRLHADPSSASPGSAADAAAGAVASGSAVRRASSASSASPVNTTRSARSKA